MDREYQLGQLLSRAQWAMKQHVNFRLKEQGLEYVTMGFLGALEALWEDDGLNMGQLAEKASLEKSTVTGLMDRMERSGLIRREADEKDRRAIRIRLTPDGWAIKERVLGAVHCAYEDLGVDISEEEVTHFVNLLHKLIRNAKSAT